MSPSRSEAIRVLPAEEFGRRLDELAALLADAVEQGASVNFMAGFTLDDARAFWRGQEAGLVADEKRVLVAEDGPDLVGTVVLSFALQPNQPHRAEIGKMLVHSRIRRRGIGRRLLLAAEDLARAAGRTLLVLDTETDSVGDRLYRACGWIAAGTIPGYALTPDGRPVGATIFYKMVA